MIWHFWHCDPDYGQRLADGVGVDIEKAKALPPLEGRPAPGQDLDVTLYDTGEPEGDSKSNPTQASVMTDSVK